MTIYEPHYSDKYCITKSLFIFKFLEKETYIAIQFNNEGQGFTKVQRNGPAFSESLTQRDQGWMRGEARGSQSWLNTADYRLGSAG